LAAVVTAFLRGRISADVRGLIGLLFGLVFAAVGLFAFETSGIEINKRAGELIEWRGFLGMRRQTVFPLPSFESFAVVRYWNRSQVGRPKLYKILAKRHAAPEEDVEILSGLASAASTYAIARRLALFAGLPVRIVDHAARADRSMSQSLPDA
jgi:hypothetical protein